MSSLPLRSTTPSTLLPPAPTFIRVTCGLVRLSGYRFITVSQTFCASGGTLLQAVLAIDTNRRPTKGMCKERDSDTHLTANTGPISKETTAVVHEESITVASVPEGESSQETRGAETLGPD